MFPSAFEEPAECAIELRLIKLKRRLNLDTKGYLVEASGTFEWTLHASPKIEGVQATEAYC